MKAFRHFEVSKDDIQVSLQGAFFLISKYSLGSDRYFRSNNSRHIYVTKSTREKLHSLKSHCWTHQGSKSSFTESVHQRCTTITYIRR